MTVVRLKKHIRETPRPASKTGPMAAYRTPKMHRLLGKELVFGLTITAIILGLAALTAFNGGISLETGKLQMTLDASFTEGLHLSFVSL